MAEQNTNKAVKKRKTEKSSRQNEKRRGMAAPDKMQLLFTIVNREKTEFYLDLLQSYEVNMQTVLSASGTASTQMMELLGLANTDKSVILSVIRRDKAKMAMAMLDEKFKTVRGGKGIAYTVPMSSIIGVAIYQFLSNKGSGILQGG